MHHNYAVVELVADAGRVRVPELSWLWEPFAPVWQARLSWIGPDGYILPHVDAGPYRERWQVPFTTEGCLFQNGIPVRHQPGAPFRVRHDRWHSVVNPTAVPRISLVVDRDVLLGVPSAPFRLKET